MMDSTPSRVHPLRTSGCAIPVRNLRDHNRLPSLPLPTDWRNRACRIRDNSRLRVP